MQASKTQFIVVTPEGAVQAAVAIVPGKGTILVQPSATAHGSITMIDTNGNSFQVPCFKYYRGLAAANLAFSYSQAGVACMRTCRACCMHCQSQASPLVWSPEILGCAASALCECFHLYRKLPHVLTDTISRVHACLQRSIPQ